VRWCGNGIFDSRDFTICYSGNNEQIQFGTGFVIHKKYKSLIMDFNPENERLCSLRMKGRSFNTTLVCLHAPTEEKDVDQKYTFYDKLKRLYMKSPKHDIKIILGDFNAKVGKEQDVTLNAGKFSLHEETTNNGWRMVGFCNCQENLN
jgi:exonuclease III